MTKARRLFFASLIIAFTLSVASSIAVTSMQHKLGRCSASIEGVNLGKFWVGPPWAFFSLDRRCRALAPRDFARGFGTILLGGVMGAALCFGLAFSSSKPRQRRDLFGSASWATAKEVEVLGVLKDEGIFVGKLDDGRFIRHDGPEHAAVIAPTRSGKGVGIVLPTLLTWPGSAFIHDLKEENRKITEAARSKFSDTITFNPAGTDSAHYNPLLDIRPGIFEVRDTQNLAGMIIEPDTLGTDTHWILTGVAMLTSTILHVLYVCPPEEKNLAGVTNFLSRAEKCLAETFHEMMETKHIRDPKTGESYPHPGIVAAARDVLTKSHEDMSGVHSTVMGRLALYRDPLLAHNTRDSDFTIADLVSRERPVTLYYVVAPSDINRLRPLTRILVNQICRRLTEPEYLGENVSNKHRLLLMLDEFPALGHLEFFETALGFIAGYGLKTVLICQSINQLKSVYGERTSILDNTHVRAFFRPNTIETAKYLSESLGEETVVFETEAHSGKVGSPFFSGKSKSGHVGKRQLLTAREVMELPDEDEILFIGGCKPIRCKKICYWNDTVFKPLLETPPVPGAKSGFDRAGKSPWFDERYVAEPTAEETPSSADNEEADSRQEEEIAVPEVRVEPCEKKSDEKTPRDDDGEDIV